VSWALCVLRVVGSNRPRSKNSSFFAVVSRLCRPKPAFFRLFAGPLISPLKSAVAYRKVGFLGLNSIVVSGY
jgi:hypothetical protein